MLDTTTLNARKQAADDAYASYDFGWEITDAQAWQDTEGDDWTKLCYGEADVPGDDRERLNLHVRFAPGTAEVLESYALRLSTGDLVGGPACTPQERAEALGFPSAEAMEDHQHWVSQVKRHEDEVRGAIAQAGDSPIIDLREVHWP